MNNENANNEYEEEEEQQSENENNDESPNESTNNTDNNGNPNDVIENMGALDDAPYVADRSKKARRAKAEAIRQKLQSDADKASFETLLTTIGLSDPEVQTFMLATGFQHVHDLRTITVVDLQQVAKQARTSGGVFPLLAEKDLLH